MACDCGHPRIDFYQSVFSFMATNLWLAFLLASILIAVSPGPGAALSMSNGLRYGYRTTLRSIAGLQCALAIHVGIVAVGLGALLTAFPFAFDAIRYLGAAYLVWRCIWM